MGILALTCLLVVELAAAAASKGGWAGVEAYFTGRDMVAGPAYALTLQVYTMLPRCLVQVDSSQALYNRNSARSDVP
jgi:hypothetical protein